MGYLLDEALKNRAELRFFTKSPFKELYVTHSEPMKYCENTSFWLWATKAMEWKGHLAPSENHVAEYLRAQTAILMYNNPNAPIRSLTKSLYSIVKWGSRAVDIHPIIEENDISLKDIVEYVHESGDFEDFILFDKRHHWYSDEVEFIPKEPEHTWKEHINSIISWKAKLRTATNHKVMREYITAQSEKYKEDNDSLIPTAPILSKLSKHTPYIVKTVTDEDIHWQQKKSHTKQRIEIYMEQNPDATQKEIAKELKIGLRTVKEYK